MKKNILLTFFILLSNIVRADNIKIKEDICSYLKKNNYTHRVIPFSLDELPQDKKNRVLSNSVYDDYKREFACDYINSSFDLGLFSNHYLGNPVADKYIREKMNNSESLLFHEFLKIRKKLVKIRDYSLFSGLILSFKVNALKKRLLKLHNIIAEIQYDPNSELSPTFLQCLYDEARIRMSLLHFQRRVGDDFFPSKSILSSSMNDIIYGISDSDNFIGLDGMINCVSNVILFDL